MVIAWLVGAVAGFCADVRFETGTGNPLQTAQTEVVLPASPVRVGFEIAFATEEVSQPGVFFDSLTFTLQAMNPSSTAVLLTMDASGLVLGPPTPGGLMIPGGALTATSIPYFGSASDPVNRSAYSVLFDMPTELAGRPGTFYFDLFDNGNTSRSVGYLQNFAVVPEPSLVWLLLSGLASFAVFKRCR